MNSSSNAGKFRFWQALAASLALHALLLAQALPPAHVPAAAAPLAATLRQAAEYAVVRADARTTAYATESATEMAGERQAEAPVTSGAAAAQSRPAAVARGAPATESEVPTHTRSSAATGEPGVASAPAEDSPAASPGLDADSLRLYRFSLAAAARRFKRYPALAIERGESGRAEVTLSIAANGSSRAPWLTASSGSSLLDQAAVDMVARAASATAVPARLQGAPFAVLLPVEFDLNEGEQ